MSLFPTYKRFPLKLAAGSGTIVTDEDGQDYLDFMSGIAVNNLGHRPPQVQNSLEEQLDQVWHVSNIFSIPIQEKAAERLLSPTDLDAVFFCNSGAEANEAAIKLARKHTGKSKIVTFQQSFHGRTFATMSATGQEKVHDGFGPLLQTFDYLPFNDVQELEALSGEDIAAICIEVIQGEGGVRTADSSFLENVQLKCRELDALLIVDEIQTGIGRTGKPFAYQHHGLDPDIVTTAKGLGSGFPVGAMLGKESLIPSFHHGTHGTTFGGNPLASSAVIATLDTIFDAPFLQEVNEKADYLFTRLHESLNHQCIKEIRGKGLMVGIELTKNALPIVQAAQSHHLLVVPAGPQVVRLLPPLTVTYEEMDQAVRILADTLTEAENQKAPLA
ncbi:acetylornithine transaminase [Thalassobacillus sp. CUG 92003]|uniref:acetylornithine transaminase n=1 Tax=Thalassobacillus sp. CUG 92003 TaxID=2736641 RepID=UPI0015E7320B